MSRLHPPVLATWLLHRLGTGSLDLESLQGDLIEQYRGGRSRAWYWRQALMAIVVGSTREIGAHKLLAVRAVATGWAVLLLTFGLLGDRVANGLANLLWNWTREIGYSTQLWSPFWVCAVFVSYGGFAMSAWIVVRLHRSHAGSMLLAYLASVFVALVASAVMIDVLTGMMGPRVPVPHALFYVVSVTLPYQGRTGLVLVPLIILLTGLCGSGRLTATAPDRS